MRHTMPHKIKQLIIEDLSCVELLALINEGLRMRFGWPEQKKSMGCEELQ